MKDNRICGIVRDLLPLYIDGVCSEPSNKLIEKHLTECGECLKIKELLSDKTIEKTVKDEKEGVLSRHAAKERSAAWKAGAVIAGILLIPIIIVAIVTASGHASAGTLLVLIASMGLVAAITVLPLMTKKNRFAKAVLFSTAALLLIELFVCLFFSGDSFPEVAVPTVFGISVAFLPFIMRKADLPEPFSDKKALIVLAWDTIWLYLTVIVSLWGSNAAYMYEGIAITTLCVILPWAIFAATRIKAAALSKCVRAGIIVLVSGLWVLLAEHQAFVDGVFRWTNNSALNEKLYVLIPALAVIAGAVLIVTGVVRRRNRKN